MKLGNLSVLNYRRGLGLMVIGAIIGLLLAAYGLFTAKGTSTFLVPAEDVALVNQQPIVRSDFDAQLRTLYDVGPAHATPEQRRRVLDDMIREELFVQRGIELDVATADPSVRMALVSAVEQQNATDAMTAMPSAEKLLAYYTANKPRYSSDGYFIAREIVFPTGSAAQLAVAKGLSADQAIARFGGHDSKRIDGPEFYFAAAIHLGDKLAKMAMALPNGGVSAPVTLPDGVHMIFMEKNVPPEALEFAKAEAKVLADYRQENAQRMQIHEQEFLRKRANVLIAGGLK
jgi:parvulin-like peptidyl-prolyl isomerase